MIYVVIDSDGTIYGVFSSRPKAEECIALVYKWQGIDPENEYFGWWVTIQELELNVPDKKLTEEKS